jgi:SAM-dependent methyltransferase
MVPHQGHCGAVPPAPLVWLEGVSGNYALTFLSMTNAPKDSTHRFSSRVGPYAKYRPHYPAAILNILTSACVLSPASVIADVGSGTGILTELFLKNGNSVFGVEPNREMREAGEILLRDYSRFTSVAGGAEATTLADSSVDLIAAGQAFHWFDCQRARREFLRILKPQGWVVLVWNFRCTSGTPFLEAYEQLLLKYTTDYEAVASKQTDRGAVESFFGKGCFRSEALRNHQNFDFEGLKGRLLSSSYTIEAGHPQYEAMLRDLESIFKSHQANGTVRFEYDTTVYYGQLE